MKRIITLLIALCASIVCLANETNIAKELAKRIIPNQAGSFKFVQTSDTSDVSELSSKGGKIIISGNNANSMAVGLNYYLKYYCHTLVSWYANDPVEMPETLPTLPSKVRVNARIGERFFLNYCTLGYTMPGWQWKDWERLIDWMALNGITMPLAITGEEAVWEKVWQKYGMTAEEIRSFFTGPAFLPWHRMMNVDGWMGPLPQKWIDAQAELQKKILARERSLNMTPVLPAFSGHMPAALKARYPEAKITDVFDWGEFGASMNCHFLDPRDPLFAKIQKDYLEEQAKMYGTDHIYGVDLFNEVKAPSWDPETLGAMSKAVYGSMSAVDKDARWLQMGWMFIHEDKEWTPENIKSYLRAVPQDKMILLDYYCDAVEIWQRTDSFYGQPFFFCALLNFGGFTNLEGDFHQLSAKVDGAFKNARSLFGLGATMEGFGVNAFMFDFFFDKAWNTGISDSEWVKNLSACRVGFSNPQVESTWKMLVDSIYTKRRRYPANKISMERPKMLAAGNRPYIKQIANGYKQVGRAWTSMISNASVISPLSDAYKFDIVNLGRQVLGEYFPKSYYAFCDAYDSKATVSMRLRGKEMMEVLADMDRLLACHRTFSLEDWNNAARAWGNTSAEKDYYEENAREIITYWGGSGGLTDYAERQWAGMMMSYYGYRWQRFIDEAIAAVKAGKSFDQVAFNKEMRTFEIAWTKPSFKIDYPKASDPVSTAKRISAKIRLN